MLHSLRIVMLWIAALVCGAASGAASGAENPLHYNQVRFQVTASRTVANDHMRAVLVVQDEGDDSAQLADRINRTMAWALQQSKGRTGIEVRSGGYATQPVYNKNALAGWRASQELSLEGGDFGAIGQLVGVLQQRLQLHAVAFSIAPRTKLAVEAQLIDEALDGFKRRAEQVRGNIGTPGYRIVEININTEDLPVQPMPMLRAEAMSLSAKSVAAPGFEGGDSDVRVSVQGTVQLQ